MECKIDILDGLEVPNGFRVGLTVAHVTPYCLCLGEKFSHLRPQSQCFGRGKVRARERLYDNLFDRHSDFGLLQNYGAPIWHLQNPF
ncbi:hypothetical protein B0E45_07905 [Sinorhizobium sp. A49]|nr:hypothetical protein B0E45_07905 [Sinorhizobium sp. A49]